VLRHQQIKSTDTDKKPLLSIGYNLGIMVTVTEIPLGGNFEVMVTVTEIAEIA